MYVRCQHYTLARLLAIAILDYLQTSDWVSVEVARDLFGSVWDVVLGNNASIDQSPKRFRAAPSHTLSSVFQWDLVSGSKML